MAAHQLQSVATILSDIHYMALVLKQQISKRGTLDKAHYRQMDDADQFVLTGKKAVQKNLEKLVGGEQIINMTL